MATTRFSGVTTTEEKNIQGGSIVSLPMTTDSTLAIGDIKYGSLLNVTPTASLNVTTPTAAQLIENIVPVAGDTFSFLYRNSATATYSTTIVAGSDVVLLEPSGGDVVIAATEWADFKVINIGGDDVAIIVTSIQNAD